MPRGLAAVTGATGFLGRQLVRELALSGWRVRVLARGEVIHPLWRGIEPEVALGHLADDAALARLCEGADLVVHAAGLTKARDRAAFEAVNVEGARRAAQAAPGAMLLVSSLAAREPGLSHYAASKRGGEAAARAILGERLTVVRPTALYGPGDPATLPLFRLAAASPVLPVLDSAARITLMHVQDAARQIAAVAASPAGGALTLTDQCPQGYSWREIMEAAAAAFGTRPRFVRLPGVAVDLAAVASLVTYGRGAAPMMSLGKAREIKHRDWSVSLDEQSVALPSPIFDLRSGFRHTVDAYRASGAIFGTVKRL